MTAKLLAPTVPLTRNELSKPPEKTLVVRAPLPGPEGPTACCRRRTLHTVRATIATRASSKSGPSRGPRFFSGGAGVGDGPGSKGAVTGAGASGDASPTLRYKPLKSLRGSNAIRRGIV